ncbi:MAG: FHA domain-containing protein [Myxococcaceae bacterium]
MSGNLSGNRVLRIYGDGTFAEFPLPAAGSVVIGRDEGADVQLDDRSASRTHARILCGERLEIEDLGAQNGTKLGDRKLVAGRREMLKPGVVIEIGSTLLLVQPADAPKRSARIWQFGHFVALVDERVERGESVTLARVPVPLGVRDRVLSAALLEVLGERDVAGWYGPGELQLLVQREEVVRMLASRLELTPDERWVTASSPGSAYELLARVAPQPLRSVAVTVPAPVALQQVIARLRETGAPIALLGEDAVAKDAVARELGRESVSDAAVRLLVPALRDRKEELEALATMFVEAAAQGRSIPAPRLSPDAVASIRSHAWRGNLAELRLALERAVFLCSSGVITSQLIPQEALAPHPWTRRGGEPEDITDPNSQPADRAREERERIIEALKKAEGNQTKAAALLGISRRTLVKRVADYGLPRPRKSR